MFPVIGSMFKEPIDYTTGAPAAEVKKSIEDLFYRTRGFRFYPNIGGEFVSEYEFVAYPKIELSGARFFPGTRIKGTVVPGNKETGVEITMLPNYNYLVLFLVSVVVGGALTIQAYTNHFQKPADNTGPQILLYGSLSILLISYFTKFFLKRAFEHALERSARQ